MSWEVLLVLFILVLVFGAFVSQSSWKVATTSPTTYRKPKYHTNRPRSKSPRSSNAQPASTSKQSRRRRARSKKGNNALPALHVIPCDYSAYYKPLPFPTLPPEVETGNREYKLKLEPPNEDRFQQLITQMKYRIVNGNGHAYYEIGVQDDGTPCGVPENVFKNSLNTLGCMAAKLGASLQVVKVRDGSQPSCLAGELIVKKIAKESDVSNEVRVAICGDVDAGKSTLLGVLSSGELDNGRGQARMNIFKHKHELENGKTSDVGREILGFDSDGNVVNYSSLQTLTWSEIIENSKKVVCFMDLAGDKKYFKTTVCGMTGYFPDYAMLLVDSKVGTIGMTQEHYNLAVALQIPMILVVTKIDICPPEALQGTIDSLTKILQVGESTRKPILIESEESVAEAARLFYSDGLAPIFQISNVTGAGLDLLRNFLSIVNPVKDWKAEREKGALLYIDDTFSVPDVGTVVSGTLLQGKIEPADTLLLGPNQENNFTSVTVSSIHANRLPVQIAYPGQSICVALANIDRSECKKGQALASERLRPAAVWEFEASVCLLSESSVVPQKYETVVHCGCSKQTAILLEVQDEESFGNGAAARVRFKYKYHAEFLQPGDRFVFREGSSGGVGTVLKIIEPNSVDFPSLILDTAEEASVCSKSAQ